MSSSDEDKIFPGNFRTYFVYLNTGTAIALFLVLIFYIIWQILKFVRKTAKRTDHGDKISSMVFILALFFKIAGFASQAILYYYVTDGSQLRFTILTGGFPSYVSSVCYLLIFISWCSIYQELLENNSTDTYEKSKTFLMWFVIITLSLGIILTVLVIAITNETYSTPIHSVETAIALIRDVAFVIAFIFYLRGLASITGTYFPSFKSLEFSVFFLCWDLIFAIVIRFISTLIYLIVHRLGESVEFSSGHFAWTIIQMTIGEIFSFYLIAYSKLNSDIKYNDDIQKNIVNAEM